MSMYTHQPHYNQPPTSSSYAQSYPAPAHQFHYPPPPQPDPYTMSPDAFRQWFMGQLAHVVVNQKNIIHHIAFIAKEHAQRMGPIIAQSLEQHIRRANPQVKLPPWYLLDSISKNIGPPYTHLFSSFVAQLFLESYHAVDVSTRAKMEEMLVTWRTGAAGGRELFGVDIQNYIESSVWKAGVSTSARRGAHPYRRPSRMSPTSIRSMQSSSSGSRGPTKAQVLTELDVILTQKNRAVELDPYDTVSLGHVDTLNQLRALVQTSQVSSEELKAIVMQLRNLARSTASAAPPVGAIPPPMPAPQSYPSVPQSYQYQQPAPALSTAYPSASSYGGSAGAVHPLYGANYASASSSNMSSVPAATPAPVPAIPSAAALSSLFSNLVKAGVVSATPPSATPPTALSAAGLSSLSALLAGSAVKPESQDSDANAAMHRELEAERDYERMILGLEVSMTAMGVQREEPAVISLLYDHLPLQCKQCAQRFPDDSHIGNGIGKKRFQDHLDEHFKQNLRTVAASSNVGTGTLGRGHTRSWFVGKQDWVTDITVAQGSSSNAAKGKARAPSPPTSGNTSSTKAISEERMAQLRSSYIIIPPGDEAQPRRCPICKEFVKTEYLDDDEEWVWRNAIMVKEKLYHATCHAEALASNLAQRRKNEVLSGGRSRSATPPWSPSAVKMELGAEPAVRGSPLAGSKRKVEEIDNSDSDSSASSNSSSASGRSTGQIVVKREEEDNLTPPLKKIALAS